MIKRCLDYGKKIMSHHRDIWVVHTETNNVLFHIPLYFEQDLSFKDIIIESGKLVIVCQKVDERGGRERYSLVKST